MKKYLLGIFAVVLAIGFSAFTVNKKNNAKAQTTYYWFEVDPGAGDESQFVDGDVTFISGYNNGNPSATAPTDRCEATPPNEHDYKCVVGFATADVVDGHIDELDPVTPAATQMRYRATE